MDDLLNEKKEKIISQALWDLNITPAAFVGIIRGSVTREWPSRDFCVARLLESVNWFDVVTIFSPEEICAAWAGARKYLRSDSVREGMDFACRILR